MKVLFFIAILLIWQNVKSQEATTNVGTNVQFDYNKLLSTMNFPDELTVTGGKIVIKAFVKSNAEVEKTEIISGANTKLAELVAKKVKEFKGFTPSIYNGENVGSWVELTFELTKSNGEKVHYYNANPNEENITLDKYPGIDMTKLMSYVVYPEEAYKNKQEGKVIASVLINESGDAEDIKITSSDNIVFNLNVINAIKKYGKFTPAEKDSIKVKSWVSIPFDFIYKEKENKKSANKDGDVVQAQVDLKKLQKLVHYPKEARDKSVEGKVILKILINEKGKFVNTLVEHTDNKLLNEAALKAANDLGQAEKPASKAGKSVASWVFLPIEFRLK